MADLIEKAFKRLGKQLSGHLSMPGDDAYSAATAIFAKPVGAMPRAVSHCRTREDVQAAIRAARECYLPLSVRGGGHDWAGRALCDGLVIDLSPMNQVVVGSDFRTAQIAGGALASDVLAVTDPLELAIPLGSVGAVGVAGLTLGGGYGALIGRCGLVLDNLVAAEVVLADGRVVVASQNSEEELFWALRGGGGNFGVVTAMHHRLHDLPSVRSGMLIYPFAEAKSVLQGCVEALAQAPDELTAQMGIVTGPSGPPVVFIVPTWSGRPEEGAARLAPFCKLGSLLTCNVMKHSYGDSLRIFDGHFANGQRVFMETSWLPVLDGGSIDVLIQAMENAASPGCAIITHEFKGAATRVPLEATAFGLRREHMLVEILATFTDHSDIREEIRHQHWARSTRQSLHARALPGGYPNLLAGADTERVGKSYGSNLDRLLRAKRQYDPVNLFSSAIPLPLHQHKRQHLLSTSH